MFDRSGRSHHPGRPRQRATSRPLPSLPHAATASAVSAHGDPRRARPRASSASRGRCSRSSPVCRRRARGSRPWLRASALSPVARCPTPRPKAVRGRLKSASKSAPAPASPPSAPLGPVPSECLAAASSHPPSVYIGARPPSAGTFLRVAPCRSPLQIDRPRSSQTSAIVWPSTPAEPLFRLTRFHASHRTSLL